MLARARSSLAKARGGVAIEGVFLEDLCFDAQQAAEKALKALLISLSVRFPRTHDLRRHLVLLEESGKEVPQRIKEVARLTDYAVQARYPSGAEGVTPEEYEEAVRIAEETIRWAREAIGGGE